jgi:hypothetical protein
MNGTITKKTLVRHPYLIISLFGWRVWVKGLAMQHGTFLELIR